jgi:hypothetical protein
MCSGGAQEYTLFIFSKVVTGRDRRRFVGNVFVKADIFVFKKVNFV